MFKYYENLGFNSPYYFNKQGKICIHATFQETICNFDETKQIDPVTIVEVLNKNHAFGDRTVFQNIYKTPWLAKPNFSFTEWEFAPPPIHGTLKDKENIIARNFFDLLCREILGYIQGKKSVGILLSGGMDSRIVAGVLNYLIETNQATLEVTALTWGNTNSRDVVYAEQIAKILGWKWKHFIVTGKDLLKNVVETGIRGCEYSPIHLHALPQIREIDHFDIILAGSYGDSVGRAEYGGVHVSKLPEINLRILNVGNLVDNDLFLSSLPTIKQDIDNYHMKFAAKEEYMQNEYDYQLHYMRRQLNPCMELLNEKASFFQVFTNPNTFRYIWNIDVSLRNDDLYKSLLSHLKKDLSLIPWARTGLIYGQKRGTPDIYSKRHHSYVEILNSEILDSLKEYVLSQEIKKLGIFNYSSLEELFRLVKKYPLNNSFYYTEKLAWIASLSVLVDRFQPEGKNIERENNNIQKKQTSNEYMKRYYRNRVGKYLRKFKLIK